MYSVIWYRNITPSALFFTLCSPTLSFTGLLLYIETEHILCRTLHFCLQKESAHRFFAWCLVKMCPKKLWHMIFDFIESFEMQQRAFYLLTKSAHRFIKDSGTCVFILQTINIATEATHSALCGFFSFCTKFSSAVHVFFKQNSNYKVNVGFTFATENPTTMGHWTLWLAANLCQVTKPSPVWIQ